jgi:hypothetical protein
LLLKPVIIPPNFCFVASASLLSFADLNFSHSPVKK